MEEKQNPGTGKRKLMKVILVISLGFNILILGLVGGAMIRGGPPDHFRPDRDVTVLGLRAYYRAMQNSDRQKLQAGIKASRGQIKSGRGAFRAHLKELSQALLAEPYDAAAVEAVLSGQANVISGNISIGQRLILEQIAQMTPQARQEMAAQLLKLPKRPVRYKN